MKRCLSIGLLGMMLAAQEARLPGWSPVPWASLPDPSLDPAFQGQEREALLTSLDHTLAWLRTPAAEQAYALEHRHALGWIRTSLSAFREVVAHAQDQATLRETLMARFQPYVLDGGDPARFTGYCEAWFEASRTPSTAYRYPLYRRPKDLPRWASPHPTRLDLEGRDGLRGAKGRLKGLELVWLKHRFDAYLIHVQGSARLHLAQGGYMDVAYAGRTNHPFVAIGEALMKDLAAQGTPSPPGGAYAYLRTHPELQDRYLPRNPRFVFFAESQGPRRGAYGMPLTPYRSFAADQTHLPPGALALLHVDPNPGTPTSTPMLRFALHHDKGGAIQGAGRADIYVGGGPEAMTLAGAINGPGRLVLLLLNQDPGKG